MLKNHIDSFVSDHDELKDSECLAVAVSGGPDSMAMTDLLIDYACGNDIALHILTVDHALRPESKAETQTVGDWVQSLGHAHIKHKILTWQHDNPDRALMEQARQARYELMAGYCRENNIQHLFIAHHGDDQAETFLFRLSKGSGLDGLASMASKQVYSDHLTLWRPLLDVPKQELIAYCDDKNLPYVNDPSNEKQDYARPRLRAAKEVLEREGLTSERLSLTAKRLRRARAALEVIANQTYEGALKTKDGDALCLDWAYLRQQPEEIGLRVFSKALHDMQSQEKPYGIRMEKIEELFSALWWQSDLSSFKRRTLGGCMISFRDDQLVLEKEK